MDPVLSHSFLIGWYGRSEYFVARISNSSTASSSLFSTTMWLPRAVPWMMLPMAEISERAEQVIWLTVILLFPFNVDAGDISSWKFKDIANDGLRVRPRWIRSVLFAQRYILSEQQGDKDCDWEGEKCRHWEWWMEARVAYLYKMLGHLLARKMVSSDVIAHVPF